MEIELKCKWCEVEMPESELNSEGHCDRCDRAIEAKEGKKEKTYRILSIDAWNGCCAGCGCEEGSETCWTWNAWYPVGHFDGNIDGDIVRQLVEAGFLKDSAIEGCKVEDDGWNVVVCRKDNSEPLYAIEYGDSE